MDAMMHDDKSPQLLARAFLDGNYSLEGLHPEQNKGKTTQE
jgi:hypothetical protein